MHAMGLEAVEWPRHDACNLLPANIRPPCAADYSATWLQALRACHWKAIRQLKDSCPHHIIASCSTDQSASWLHILRTWTQVIA